MNNFLIRIFVQRPNYLVNLSKSLTRNFSKMSPKNLAAFDFDQTVVEQNSDVVVRRLLKPGDIPRYQGDGWPTYMQDIFERLKLNGIDKTAIEAIVKGLNPVRGMPELLKHLSETLNYDIVIVSDANSYFINTWLKHTRLDRCIEEIFTNPANFENGLLKVSDFSYQESCALCEKNICKGKVIEEFVEQKKNEGVRYSKIVYVGDGANDFCPMLRLSSQDLACCRDGYNCSQLIAAAKEGTKYKNQVNIMKADVFRWKDGFDILEKIKQNCL